MTPEPPTPYRNAAEMHAELTALSDRASAFVKSVQVTADDVELHVADGGCWGYRFVDGVMSPVAPVRNRVTHARVYLGDRVGVACVAGSTRNAWFEAVEQAALRLAESPEPMPGAPASAFPEPVTFDPQLADFACEQEALGELAGALLDNTVHEIQRSNGTRSPDGTLQYAVRMVALARNRGVRTALSGALTAELKFREGFIERVVQIHCPESFLPIALMGARAWRNKPAIVVDPSRLKLGQAVSIVIHPRALENLLRTAGGRLFHPSAAKVIPNGVKVASENLTLIDDPHLDGLRYSRAFDDSGTATRRLPLVVNGRLTQRFSSGLAINPLKGVSGNRWYRGWGPEPYTPRFSSLLIDRGATGFHELIGARPRHVLINSLGSFDVGRDPTGRFSAMIESAVLIDNGGPNRLIPTNALRLEGQLFGAPGGSPGLLSDVQVSRELHDTGSAVLPYMVTSWQLKHGPR